LRAEGEAIQAEVPHLDCFVAFAPRNDGAVIASEAKQSRKAARLLNCFVASLLAMTETA
jgi:hypothetical protein